MTRIKTGVEFDDFDPNNPDHLSHGLWAFHNSYEFTTHARGGAVSKFNSASAPVKIWEFTDRWVLRGHKDTVTQESDTCENCGGSVKDTYDTQGYSRYSRWYESLGWTTHRRNGKIVYPLKCEYLCKPCAAMVST